MCSTCCIFTCTAENDVKPQHGLCAVQPLFLTCTMQQGSSGLQKAEKLAPSLLAATPCMGRLADLYSRVTVLGTIIQLKACMRCLQQVHLDSNVATA